MPRLHVQALVAVISVALLLPRVSGAPRAEEPSDVLQDRMPHGREEGARMLLVRLVSELRPGAGPGAGPGPGGEAAPGAGRRDVPLGRRRVCKYFFWKTFTLC